MDNNNSEIKTTLTLGISRGEELVISKKKSTDNLPYTAWGSGGTRKTEDGSMIQTHDIVNCMLDMDANEKFCFSMLYRSTKKASYFRDNVFYTEYVQRITKLSKQESKKFLAGFKKLEQKDLVRRIKRGYYMLSPYLLIDTSPNKELHSNIWANVKAGDNTKPIQDVVKQVPVRYCTCPPFVISTGSVTIREGITYCDSCEMQRVNK